jgi:hypothetical protein
MAMVRDWERWLEDMDIDDLKQIDAGFAMLEIWSKLFREFEGLRSVRNMVAAETSHRFFKEIRNSSTGRFETQVQAKIDAHITAHNKRVAGEQA